MFRALLKITCLALLALPLAPLAFAETGGPNAPEMTGNSPERLATWQENPWGDRDGMMSKGKKSKAARAMCEKMRAEYTAIEEEQGALRMRCTDAKGLDRMNCENRMEELEERQMSLHDKMSMMHDKMATKQKKPAKKMRKSAPKADKKLPSVEQQ